MRKLIAFFLVLVMVCSLFGCNKPQDDDKPSCAVADMLMAQAVSMAQQIGLSAEGSNMQALSMPSETIGLASTFRKAAQAEPADAKVFTGSKDYANGILQICGKLYSKVQLSCCSSLMISTQISLPKTLKEETAVYLRYNNNCHMIVVFKPLEDGVVSVWAYPLFSNAVNRVLNVYGEKAEEWGGSQVMESCKLAADVNFQARCTGKTADAAYYSALATSAFANIEKISGKQVANYTMDKKVVANVLAISASLSKGIESVQVYSYPQNTQSQVDEVLAKLTSQNLAELTTMRLYLTFPNQIANTYGVDWIATSSILNNLINANNLGIAAAEDESPVLVLLGLSGGYSVVMSIYPNEYNVYQCGFSFLPLSFSEAQEMMETKGANIMQ